MAMYEKIDNFYIEEGEKPLIGKIMPQHYIDRNLANGNVNANYAIRFLQNELNSVLNSFINGGFSKKGYILYPLVKGVSRENIKRMRRLGQIAVFLDNNGYDFSDSIKKCKWHPNSKNFAAMLSALYNDFSGIKDKGAKTVKKPRCKELDLESYKKADSGYLRPLKELKEYADDKLKGHLSGFYLHGSFATKDYVKGWSDVDTLAVISKEAIENPKRILDLRAKMYYMRRFFYKIEPLQHHGSILISEHDLKNYCQAYFPIPVFRYAKSFFRDRRSIFKARGYSSEALAKLFWFVSYFRRLNAEKRFEMGSYDAKTLLHSITLFPSLYLQAKGTLVYKKFSFGIARTDFKKESWEVMDNASLMRSNWKSSGAVPLISRYSGINPLLYYQLNSRIMDILKKRNKIDIMYLVKNMHRLSEEAWGKVKKDAKNKKV